jgi:hypothetical protein
MSKQWHPVFTQLLRPLVEDFYELQTTVPVGDAPRQADIVLLRRIAHTSPPFCGLWRYLTTWNILEFKGPTSSPRRRDIELLVELGLGIDRRLRSEKEPRARHRPTPVEVSFWYLANNLGRRFLLDAQHKLGLLDALAPGLWRGRALHHPMFFVSALDLPVELDSLPLHIIGREPLTIEREVAKLVMEQQPKLQALYGGWMASLHSNAWEEIENMARQKLRPFKIDLMPVIERFGLKYVLDQVGVERVIEALGPRRAIEAIGEKEAIKQIGLDRLIANLTPAERRELKRRLS